MSCERKCPCLSVGCTEGDAPEFVARVANSCGLCHRAFSHRALLALGDDGDAGKVVTLLSFAVVDPRLMAYAKSIK